MLLLTRPALLAGALRGSIDIPALALTLFALDALLRRRFDAALILLGVRRAAAARGVAAVVRGRRPGALWREGGRALEIVALALAAPVLWCAADLIVTGDPLFSLTGTRSLAEELGRASGARTRRCSCRDLIAGVIGLPLLLAGAVALLALSEHPSPRFKATLAVLLLALATFVVIGAAGLPLLARYLLPAAALLAILGAGVATTARRRSWLRVVAIACLLAAAPGHGHRAARRRRRLARPARRAGRPAHARPRRAAASR